MNHDSFDFEVSWDILENALRQIHSKNASKLSFEKLYRNAHILVLNNKGEELYNRVSALEQEMLRDNVRREIVQTVTPSLYLRSPSDRVSSQAHQIRADGERFLKILKDSYGDHQLCMNMITDVLMYMVSSYRFLLDMRVFRWLTVYLPPIEPYILP
jgi:cullin 3